MRITSTNLVDVKLVDVMRMRYYSLTLGDERACALHPLKGVSKEIKFTNGYCMLASCFNSYFLGLVANKKLAV